MAFPRSGRSPTWRLEVRDSGKPPESVLAATFPISARQAFLGPGLAKLQGACGVNSISKTEQALLTTQGLHGTKQGAAKGRTESGKDGHYCEEHGRQRKSERIIGSNAKKQARQRTTEDQRAKQAGKDANQGKPDALVDHEGHDAYGRSAKSHADPDLANLAGGDERNQFTRGALLRVVSCL